MTVDHWIARAMAPLAVWVVVNCFDDLFIALAAGCAAIRARIARGRDRVPSESDLDAVPQRRMAIFVCLWREHGVIREMIEHNVRNIRYRNYDFFIGVYPNDTQTVAAATDVCRRFRNVHLSVTPHPGGTSKADNLNWIFQRMLLHEEKHGVRFDMVVIHDAEDVIHPDDLRWMNYYAQWYDMIQVPVLALPTPLRQFTHGVYCDEFAEFQFKDMPARELLGGFVPSSGVGTGFSRRALEAVAVAHSNQIFDATSLTEDYEIGFRIHTLGFRQKFVRIVQRNGKFVATREYFAQSFKRAVRQRSRWVTGIALQSWEKHGVRDTVRELYWFWRDRKGFFANLLTPVTNGIFVYGLATWCAAEMRHTPWGLAQEPAISWIAPHVWWTSLLVMPQTLIRMYCSSVVYGWRFGMTVPLRVPWANLINCCATGKALWGYLMATVRGVPLRWLKTEHAYPSRAALLATRPKLGEVLIGSAYIRPEDLEAAIASQPAAVRLGEHLVRLGKLSEDDLYEALGLQNDIPVGKPEPVMISPEVTRMVPADLVRRLRVLPFRVVAGQLYVASTELPDERLIRELQGFWPHEIRFQLVPPTAFKQLIDEYLPRREPAGVMSGLLTGLGVLASLLAIGRTWTRPVNGRAVEPQ
jgi:adsorption protein B